MNPYKGNGKPFVYVYFPPDEKERALSILEKFVQKNGNVSFWWSEKPLKKPEKVIDAAFSVIAFFKQAQINDKDFQNVIDAAVRCEKKILPIHLEETEYNTPWSRLALGSKQGIIRSAYKDDEQLLEKMTGAETFVDMKVTARQKKNRRSQLLRIIGGLLASALGIVGVLFFTGVIGFDPGDEKRTVQIGDFSISGTQAELDKITTLCIYGDREPTNYLVDKRVDLRGTTDDYSTFYVNPRQITEDNYFIFDNQLIRRGKISDLNWVKYLRNLEVLILDGQCIIDISPVFELKKLKRLDMMCNFVESLYILSWIAIVLYTQFMAYITQGFLNKMRIALFEKMQNLPIRYFDTNKHGDIMSRYTNDIDALRQLISQALPTLLQTIILIVAVFFIMLYYSLWMTLVVILGIFGIMFVSGKAGGGSAKFFIRQQKSLGKVEGFVQEMMNGERVVKVFNHEEQCRKDFDKLNEELFNDGFRAHAYANILGPIIQNIGNILYVLLAVVGGVLLLAKVPNIGISSLFAGAIGLVTIDILIPFLNMAKQFTGNVNGLAQQVNSVAMAMAGAERIFSMIDEKPEVDDGYVTLVNAAYGKDGSITETEKHTGRWAWKHPHGDGTLTYTPLEGQVELLDVDFAYEEGKTVLHNISLAAKPGEKIAFVGATGAGKTTITNLLNRFYDIEDGKIRYDNININKIRKADLRRSLGLVLQETNLFTGSVMDNIRYGKLDATDEECRTAAKLSGASSNV